MNFNNARQNMLLNQIRTWDYVSPAILQLMAQIHREEFVPVEHRKLAFADIEIPLAHGEFMMKPILEGRILQSLNLNGAENVLEVGTGSAYLSALLALSAKHVTSLDIHQDFTQSAIEKLHEAKIDNVKCLCQDVYTYHPTDKYDCIVVTGSVAKTPEFLFDYLNSTGKIFAIIGESPLMSAGILSQSESGQVTIETLFETDVKALIQTQKPIKFTL